MTEFRAAITAGISLKEQLRTDKAWSWASGATGPFDNALRGIETKQTKFACDFGNFNIKDLKKYMRKHSS